MDDDKVVIKNFKLEWITNKKDNYDNEMSYFKIKKETIDNKLALINKENYKLPYFMTKENKYLLKVKTKYVKLNELNKDMIYSCDADFKYYKMEDCEGYYISKLA